MSSGTAVHKFPLILLSSLQDVVQQNNTLIEEMLYLIIMLVGEFTPLTCLDGGLWGSW